MSGIDNIRQSAKTLVEASYEYDSLIGKKGGKSETDDLRKYMLQVSLHINKLIEAELKNVRS